MSVKKSPNLSQNITYIKNGQVVLKSDYFVYCTEVFAYANKYFSLINKQYYKSGVEIPGVVGAFWKTKNIQICSELHAAPEAWLKENNFELYIKPIKKSKTNGSKSNIN